MLATLFRAGSGGCGGHGGTSREVFALVEATAEHARALATAGAVAAAAERATAEATSPRSTEDITDAAAAARARPAAAPRGPARPAPSLPPPALSPALSAYAAAFAARVDDLAPPGALGCAPAEAPAAALIHARKAGAPPKLTYALTAATKLAFAPAVHAHAFELSDARGFFAGGTTKLLLRAVHDGDATEWALAINTLLETTVLGDAAGADASPARA